MECAAQMDNVPLWFGIVTAAELLGVCNVLYLEGINRLGFWSTCFLRTYSAVRLDISGLKRAFVNPKSEKVCLVKKFKSTFPPPKAQTVFFCNCKTQQCLRSNIKINVGKVHPSPKLPTILNKISLQKNPINSSNIFILSKNINQNFKKIKYLDEKPNN